MDPSSGPIRVLHVDDEPDFAALTAEYIERLSDRIVVETVTDPEVGFDRAIDERFDCVVSDYDMAGLNGIQFLERLRDADPDRPFLLFTGKGSEEVASDAISAGVTDYIQKRPGTSRFEMLVNRIENAVERQRSRDAVERAERRLRTIAENTNDVLWKFSADWNELLFVNSVYEELWGRPVSELRANPRAFLDGIHPDDRPAVEDAMERLSAGESVDIEYRVNEQTGFSRWVWVEGEPIFDEHDDVESVVGFARDVTERKRQERRFDALLEHSSDYIFIVDDTGTIAYVSPSVERLMGYEPEALVGTSAFEFTHPADLGLASEAFEELIQRPGEDVTVEFRGRTASGDYEWLEVRGRNLFNDPVVEGVLVNARMIGERKERERELTHQIDRLEELASVVSHDLRNPLSVARGHLELATEECDSEHLEGVATAHDRMSALIEDMLSLASVGDPVAETDSVRVSKVLETCWRNVETGSATLETATDGVVRADDSRLQQLVENLLRNAVEHGGPDVSVTAGTLADGFYVEDDGPGIPEAERARVLEPGYSTRDEGTGFGLSIVKQIAEAHGWDLHVTGSDDGGARFEFTAVDAAE